MLHAIQTGFEFRFQLRRRGRIQTAGKGDREFTVSHAFFNRHKNLPFIQYTPAAFTETPFAAFRMKAYGFFDYYQFTSY